MEVLFDHKKKILSAIGIGLILYLSRKNKETKNNKDEKISEGNNEGKANNKKVRYNNDLESCHG